MQIGMNILTIHDVIPDYVNVFISIRSCVLMPEPNHMTQFVHYNSEFIAILSNTDCLGTITTFTNKWTTTKILYACKIL